MTAVKGVPLAPSVAGRMAWAMAADDWRCSTDDHVTAISRGYACAVCHLSLADYVRALDVVTWP